MSVAAPIDHQTRTFLHEAFFYRDAREFLDDSLDFIRGGLAEDEPILVAVDPDKIASLQAELGPDAERVQFVAMQQAGRNPGRIISVWHDFVDQHRGQRIRGIGEPVWAGRNPDELIECQQHEHLLNHAFGDTPGFLLRCPYDVSTLAADAVAEAERSHPHVRTPGQTVPSSDFAATAGPALLGAELAPPPAGTVGLPIRRDALRHLRAHLLDQAVAAGLPEPRQTDYVLVVSELLANSIEYSDVDGTLATWAADGRLVTEVRDAGRIDDPLVGRRRPSPAARTGRGLWLTHELADLVQLRSDARGTLVRVSFDLPA